MTTHVKLTEEQWAASVAAAGLAPEGIAAPLVPAAGPAPDGIAEAITLLGAADVTVDLLGARGKLGWAARLTGSAAAHVSLVRTLDAGRTDGRVGIVPGIEIGTGTRPELLVSVLRLIPGLADGPRAPTPVTVPTEHVGAVIAATQEEDGRTRAALLDLLGWEDIPDEVASLTRIDGDVTLTLAAPGRRTRVIRLLHGHDGWISTSISRRGITYRKATGPWLRAELTWEFVAATEAAR